MTERRDDTIQPDPAVDPSERKDTAYSPSSDRDTEALQEDQAGSEALDDPTIDREDVHLLPGTGDPDDTGDIEVPEGEIHMPRLPGRTSAAPPA